MKTNKEPLYRKVNTKARGCHHHKGLDAKQSRNTKSGMTSKMKSGVERGLDYTPLYRFLLSKLGQEWDVIHSEAVSRLDKEDPIYRLVDINQTDERDAVKVGENSYWPSLIVEDGILKEKNPDLTNEDFSPSCPCCTTTFKGKVLTKKFNINRTY